MPDSDKYFARSSYAPTAPTSEGKAGADKYFARESYAPDEPGLLSRIPGAEALLSAAAPALDFLSRPQYASAGFFDALINDDKGIGDALSLALGELTNPTQRKSFTDVITRANPEFAKNNPYATKALGFLGDVALDPTTYIGFGLGGATKGARVGARALTNLGEIAQTAARQGALGSEIITGVRAGSREAGEAIAREQLTRLAPDVARGATVDFAGKGSTLFDSPSVAGLAREQQRSIGAQLRATIEASGGKLPAGVTDEAIDDLAGKISLERLGLQSFDEAENAAITFIRRQVDSGESEILGDKLIGQLASMSPDLARQVFKPGGLRLNVGIPFTSAQAEIPITAPIMRAIGLERLDRLSKTVSALPGIKQAIAVGQGARGLVDRAYGIDPALFEQIKQLDNEKAFVTGMVAREAERLSLGIPAEGRERITRVLGGFNAGIEALPEELRAAQAPAVFQAAIRTAKLEPLEQASVLAQLDGYARAADLEQAFGVAAQSAVNFEPAVYRAISGNADEAVDWIKRAGQDGVDAAGLTGEKLALGADIADAVANGANVGQDAILMYASRVAQTRNRLSRFQMDESLKALYGTADVDAIAKMPGGKRLANDLRFFGEYKTPGPDDEGAKLLKFLDSAQGYFKLTKTALNPNFAARQLPANAIQSAIAIGNNGLKAFDPRSTAAAAQIVMSQRGRAAREGLPEVMDNFLRRATTPEEYETAKALAMKNFTDAEKQKDFAFGAEFTSPTGEKITRDQLEREANQYGVLKGIGGVSGEKLKQELGNQIGTGRKATFSDKGVNGIKAILNTPLKLSAGVEDTSRLGLFLNARMMGYSPVQAAQQVNRALFDYGSGLSKFETSFLKRVIPFYSYQRFALPFALKETLENPAAPATLNKVAELFSDVLTGDGKDTPATLTQAQRELFGEGFLVDQPRIFRGLDKDGKAVFNTFSNLSPFEVFSLFNVVRDNGEVDLQATARKTIGGALTPYLKIPIEVAFNRDFFADKVIEDARGYGGAGRTSIGKDALIAQVIPDTIKEMIGWEWATDRKTGKDRAYVNPWLAYTMAQIAPPVANQFLKPLRDDETVMDRAMKVTLGLSETSIDFGEAKGIKTGQDKKYLQELKQRIVAARRTGRESSLEQAQNDYRKVLTAVQERRQRLATVATAPTNAPQVQPPAE